MHVSTRGAFDAATVDGSGADAVVAGLRAEVALWQGRAARYLHAAAAAGCADARRALADMRPAPAGWDTLENRR